MTLGLLFLLGFVTDGLGRRTPLPRVTLLLLFGFVIGPAGFDLVADLGARWFPVVADMALVMVGFLLGEKLTLTSLRQYGRLVLWISIAVVAATGGIVLVGLLLLGVPSTLALALAGIAPATAPAATTDVVHEVGADGRFARTLLGIVAVEWSNRLFRRHRRSAAPCLACHYGIQPQQGLHGCTRAIGGGRHYHARSEHGLKRQRPQATAHRLRPLRVPVAVREHRRRLHACDHPQRLRTFDLGLTWEAKMFDTKPRLCPSVDVLGVLEGIESLLDGPGAQAACRIACRQASGAAQRGAFSGSRPDGTSRPLLA